MTFPNVARRSLCIALFALVFTAAPAAAQTEYFWNAPTGGSGSWDLATQNWADASGGPVNYTWANTGLEIASFGNTAGTVTLSTGITAFGANFTTDGYTITGNTLTLAGAGGPISVTTGTATIESVIAGTVGLSKSGVGILTLSGVNTYTGTTQVTGGTLRAGAANTFTSGAYTLANIGGVTLDLNNTSQTIGSLAGGGTTGGVVAVGTGSLTVGGANTSTTFSGQLTGSGTITKVGSGTLTIAGSGTTAWTGPLTINQGVVSYAANGQLGNTGLVTLNGGTLRHTNTGSGGTFLLPTRSIAIGVNGGTIEYNTSGANTIYRGTITGPGNTLTKIGVGEFRVDTATTANYTFTRLVVNQGLYRVGGTGVETGFGAAPVAPLADAITLNGGAIGTSANITLNANRGITLGAGGGTINVTVAPLTIPSVITGSGGLSVIGDAEGDVLTLSGANNYAGATNITLSRLTAGAANTLPSTTAVTVNTGATFNTTNLNQTIGSLAGGGNVSLGTGTLTTGGNNTSTTYSGVMSGFSGSLVKLGTGTMTLSGNNTFGGGGGVTINAGTLLANGQTGTNSGTGAGPVAVNSSGTFGGTGRASGAVTVASGGTLAPGVAGAGNLTLGGNTVLNSGSEFAIGAAAPGSNSSLTVQGGTTTLDFKTGAILDLSLLGGFGPGGAYTLVTMPAGNGANVLLDAVATTDGQVLGTFVEGTGASGPVVITPSGFTLAAGDTFTLSRTGDAVLLAFSPVPEPATVLGIAAAGLGLGGFIRRRLRRA